jgi:hypothetical protein
MILEYRLSQHAIYQLENRNIDEMWIRYVLKYPDYVHIQADCVHIYQMTLRGRDSKYLLRVVVNICESPAIVITAYKTSKRGKYEN